MEKSNFTGGSDTEPFLIEYNVSDCQGGWAVTKNGTGQVVGCHKTEAEAKAQLKGMTSPVVDLRPTEDFYVEKTVDAVSFWTGAFSPVQNVILGPDFGSIGQDARFNSTYNSPPQKDGKPSVGYGNSSGGTNSN